jgi:chitinase
LLPSTAGNKALFVVGGWTGSVYFSDLMASSTKRTRFAKQLAAFQDKYRFDGIDLDWEYPNGEGIGESSAP